ncbi:MAG: hypothetical protein Q8M16_21705 [Pirellulaceae bacterium]|nr:hypothetical protein [Pirellulaceae bacterium]
MNPCRIGAIRSGVRKPKPRRNHSVANPRLDLCPQLGTRFALLFFSVWICQPSALFAQSGVAFDVPALVAVIPVDSTHETNSTAASPHRLSVQTVSQGRRNTCRYLVSLDVNAVFSEPQQFQSVMYEITPMSRIGQVIDYAPQTQATSDWAGEISSESVANKNFLLNTNLNASLPGYGTAGFLLNSTNSENTISRQSFKAPLTAVVTSGLSQRGRGVFFRFTTSRESIIEGGQKLQFVLEVPQTWRGDLLHIHCVARNVERTTHRDFLTAVTILGDETTQSMAERFAAADYETDQLLRRLNISQRPTNVLSELEQAFSRRSSSGDQIDLQRVRQSLMSANSLKQIPQYPQLPQRLRTSIDNYLDTKLGMLQLSSPMTND